MVVGHDRGNHEAQMARKRCETVFVSTDSVRTGVNCDGLSRNALDKILGSWCALRFFQGQNIGFNRFLVGV